MNKSAPIINSFKIIMRNLIILCTFILLGNTLTNAQVKITFIVNSASVDSGKNVYIVGNIPQLGKWNPAGILLNKINDSVWTKTITFNTGENLQYKFTEGTWSTEALDSNLTVPPNHQLKVSKDSIVTLSVPKWKDQVPSQSISKFHGQITGTVRYLKNLKAKGIRKRDVIIWLPPSYFKDKNKRYPVLYMQDGQNLFDPQTSSFGIDWQLDECADSLIRKNKIQEIIIVGIYNTVDRKNEYLNSKVGDAYMNFVVNKLKPMIDKKYRTLPDRENTAVGGSSAGGLISFLLAWKYPKVFSKSACISPAFDISYVNIFKSLRNYKVPKKKIKFYFDVGTVGLEAKLKPGIEEMINYLKEKEYQEGRDFEFYVATGETHNEASWSTQNWRYLEYFFSK